MELFTRALLFLLSAHIAFAAPCTTTGKRRAWYADFVFYTDLRPSSIVQRLTSLFGRHTLSNTDKLAYINAELCLMGKPSKLGLRGCKTRFDELQAVHQLQAYATHFVVGS